MECGFCYASAWFWTRPTTSTIVEQKGQKSLDSPCYIDMDVVGRVFRCGCVVVGNASAACAGYGTQPHLALTLYLYLRQQRKVGLHADEANDRKALPE